MSWELLSHWAPDCSARTAKPVAAGSALVAMLGVSLLLPASQPMMAAEAVRAIAAATARSGLKEMISAPGRRPA